MANDIDELVKAFKGKAASNASGGTNDIDQLIALFKSPTKQLVPPPANPAYFNSVARGAGQGVVDVGNTLNTAADYITDIGQDRGRYEKTTENIRKQNKADNIGACARGKQNKAYEDKYGDNPLAGVGRIGGQALATAPFVPAKAIQAGFQTPTAVAALGSGVVNRLGSTMATGAVSGAVYGAGTNAANDEGLASNLAFNTGVGAIGAPVIAGAGKLGKMVVPAYRSLMGRADVILAAGKAGLPPSAVKAVIRHLEDAGLTPDDAIQELNRLGSRATLGDIEPSLQARISGLSQLGGKPTSILRNRYGERADTADSSARQFVESKLGPKPNIEDEGLAIKTMARNLAGPDYKRAHASSDQLDISGLISHIDDELKNAVGSRANVLKEIKGYLFNTSTAADGSIVKTPKEKIEQLHPVREEIDDILKKRGEGLSPNTFGKVNAIRDKLDEVLKTNPEMAAADEAFAKHMKIKEGLQIGYDAITKKTNKDEFNKIFDTASPELQSTIRKGIHAAIIDAMEGASAGQEAATRRLFNKKEINKEILRKAFGKTGEDILDTVHNEVTQRETERLAKYGSQTALNTAIREEYQPKGGANLSDLSLAAGLDAVGAGGAAVSATIAKRGLTNRLIQFSENRRGQLTEGTADLLSRQGAERDVGMQVIDQVSKIRNRLKTPSVLEQLPLPRIPTLAAPFGGKAYSEVKEKVQ